MLYFARYMGRNIGSRFKQSATDALKTTLKRGIQKIAKATGYLIGNKITDRIFENFTNN